MRKTRLRTKFLLSFLAISAGLTSATLFFVRYSVQNRVREGLREDLRTSVKTFEVFDRQRETTLSQSAELVANLPNVRALMTTEDSRTIQDASDEVWRQSGSDFLVLANRSGEVLGMQTNDPQFQREAAQSLLRQSLSTEETRGWWLGGGHLFEVRIQPIYLGAPSRQSITGFLVVGDGIDEATAKQFGAIVSSEVAFYSGTTLVASTLTPGQQSDLTGQLQLIARSDPTGPREIQLGREKYLATTVDLSQGSGPRVNLSILKSLDQATAFLTALNRVLLGLGLLSIILGSALVFLISHTFTRPLASLVAGVRALEGGDFAFPLERKGDDEVAEVTGTFDRMRTSLQKTLNDQKMLEERLRQAHKMEAVGRLAGGVAHDFNNLLTIIRGHGDILMDRANTSDASRHNIEQIQKAANRAVSMTRQLLAFSRMQVLQPRILDLNAIVGDMGKMLPRLIGEDIDYSFAPDGKLGAVTADPGQIEQVILNLVVNARDAMPRGGKITVRTANVALDESEAAKRPPMTAGEYALLSVTDTGHGMDAETKTHIFEPFFTTKEVGKGTGLGLATVYGVVKQSGGFIWVESSPGKGATFEIYLPLTRGKVSANETETKPLAIPQGKETILVVEDEPGVRELACEFLKVSGYSVLEAKGGQEALEIATKHPGTIDAVLSDMVMPKMSGPELVGRLKQIRPEIKVLFMSGYSEYANADLTSLSPQPPILQKPFSVSSLVGKLREVLSGVEEPVGSGRTS